MLVAVVGCGGPQMARPDGFKEEMDKLKTEGRDGPTLDGADEAYTFGPYTVDGVKRNVKTSEGFDLFEGFEPAEAGAFRFSLKGGGEKKLSGRCAERAAKKSEALDGTVTKERELSLACVCEAGGDQVASAFVEDLAGEFGGPVIASGVDAQVTGVYELDNGERVRGQPAGYRIDDSSGPVAAAGVLPGETRVWIKSGLEEPDRRRMACILAGLMLWFPPRPEQD